ncbi:MAG: metallophosphoesterase [Thermoanaerobaculales bacterium]|nr:metallophosphoesterase [Thermoanaerobaculales bacterium]
MNTRRQTGILALLLLIVVACALVYCARREPGVEPVAEPLDLPTRYPPAQRIVAIGDLHGDLAATRTALQLAGAIDEHDQWAGGTMVVVQTGDQLDRGDDELEILDLLDALTAQAHAAGGAVHVLNGNHELMNVKQDLRYVTLGGFLDFLPTPVADPETVDPQVVVDAVHARLRACRPGHSFAKRLVDRNVITIVGDTVFVHGGVLPHVVDYGIERLNQEARAWIRKDRQYPPDILLASDGPVWSRHYSDDPDVEDCRLLEDVLGELGARRMVVGHTVSHEGISPACGEMVWRIDVGLARHYGGSPAVLELQNGKARVIEGEVRQH